MHGISSKGDLDVDLMPSKAKTFTINWQMHMYYKQQIQSTKGQNNQSKRSSKTYRKCTST